VPGRVTRAGRERRGPAGAVPRPLLVAGAAAFLGYASFYLLIAALPLYLRAELHLDPRRVAVVVGFTYLVNFVAYVGVGILIDRQGATPHMVWSALGVAAAGPLFALARQVWVLAAVALLQGLAMSAFALASNALAGRLAGAEGRGRQLGLFSMFNNGAVGLAPPVGVALYHATSATGLFAACLAAGLAAAAIAATLRRVGAGAPEPAPSPSARDWLGGARTLARPAAAVVAIGVPYGVLLAFMPGYLAGRGVGNPGLLYSAELVATLALRAAAGSFSDRHGRPLVAGAALLLMGVGVTSLVAVSSDLAAFGIGLVSGSGWALFGPTMLAWLFDLTPVDRRGLATATYFTSLDAGRVVGSIGLGQLVGSLGGASLFLVGGAVPVVAGVALVTFRHRLAPTAPPGGSQ
jgi:MFS family permease